MLNPRITLLTLDYPPAHGGVARYLSELVGCAEGEISVVDARLFTRRSWPRWWPLIDVCRNEIGKVILVSHVLPVGTAAWISRLSGGPEYAVLFHGLDVRLLNGPVKRLLTWLICRSARAIFANSESTKKELLRIIPGMSITVVTPGVKERLPQIQQGARQLLGIDLQKKIVLSVTRLVRRKGIDVSLRAMARIQSKEDVEYVVIGDGPDLARLEDLAAETRTSVRWLRDVRDDEKHLWIDSADVFLLPVREEKRDIEGFGIVYLEAAMSGVPCIAGRSGGASEAVRHEYTGLLVDPTSVTDITHALERLLKDTAYAETLGQNARSRAVKDFQWKSRWETMSRILLGSTKAILTDARISVVIPCYEHATTLRRTLDALSRQTLTPMEIIVVDDGSTDDPESVVRSFESRLHIRFLKLRHNHGAPTARNEGARLTSGDYLLFLDADAELTPDALERYVSALEMHPEADFAYANFFWGLKRFSSQPYDVDSLRRTNYIHTSSLIRSKSFPGFDESLKKFQDWDLWLTMAEKGSRGVWIDADMYRIEPRERGMSRWLPRIAYRIPWHLIGWTPKDVLKYRKAESIIRSKHGI
jgi:phosphatidylinositol alpha-1,6-mannosyltransferase